MDKKDIYEHLAKIYLDASSSKKRKKTKAYWKIFRNISFVSAIFILGLAITLSAAFQKNKSVNSETALVLLNDAAKINFNFDPAKKEIFSLDLRNLDLARFSSLGFSAKIANPGDKILLRVEFVNAFKEKSEIYFKEIPYKWQDYKIKLSEFKNVGDWTEMLHLSFIVEEWNAREKKGVVYIDNVKLLK